MFPHAIDSTMLGTFRSCPQKLFRNYVEHWKPKAESVHLVAGGAFASGIEAARRAFFEGELPDHHIAEPGMEIAGNRALAEGVGVMELMRKYGDFQCPPDSAKSLERTAGALEFYFENYPLGDDGCNPVTYADGRRGIEFSFAEPLDIRHPVTGNPILYTGRADMIAEFAGGVYVVDEKTTSSLGATWGRQWEMRSQFTGYCWASQQIGVSPSGVLVRGVSILKTKYDTLQHVTTRTQYEIDRWKVQTERDIARMIQCWETGYWDYALDHACAEYGGCSMLQICKSHDPETWLPMYFEKKVWDPLARKELTVEEYERSWGVES